MDITAHIKIEDESWLAHNEIDNVFCKQVAEAVFSQFPSLQKLEHIDFSIFLANDKQITELNDKFRNMAKPTDVLSFPNFEFNYQEIDEYEFNELDVYLGDIAFSFSTLTKDAKEMDKVFIEHFTHLLIHSLLHLLGFDHIDEGDARIMEQKEEELLAKFNIKSPYA